MTDPLCSGCTPCPPEDLPLLWGAPCPRGCLCLICRACRASLPSQPSEITIWCCSVLPFVLYQLYPCFEVASLGLLSLGDLHLELPPVVQSVVLMAWAPPGSHLAAWISTPDSLHMLVCVQACVQMGKSFFFRRRHGAHDLCSQEWRVDHAPKVCHPSGRSFCLAPFCLC